ncbi:MAG: hypothetical protein H7A23_23495 [Leptospiraceae bacterium]|nr:hypothetical protein [Leptospiraceae bacterium]MCP5497528.1 hypothetical protein [Leptospiraceae bacterium]
MFKKSLSTIMLFLFLLDCSSLSKSSSSDEIIDYVAKSVRTQILDNYKIIGRRTIGVASFSREEDLYKQKYVVNKLGLYLANAIHNEFFQPNRFDLVERAEVDQIIHETILSKKGAFTVEDKNAKLLLKGIHYLLLGSLQKRADTIRLNVRLVSVDSGKIVSVASEKIPINESILDLYKDDQTITATPSKKKIPVSQKLQPSNYNSNIPKNLIIQKMNGTNSKQFNFSDEIELTYKHGEKFNTTVLEIGLSKCDRSMYYRIKYNISSEWNSFHLSTDKTISLKELLSGFGKVKIPETDCFEISMILNDKTIIAKKINVIQG